VFKYSGDNRYDDTNVATHDQQKLSALSTNTLTPHKQIAAAYDVIGIDEGQFVSIYNKIDTYLYRHSFNKNQSALRCFFFFIIIIIIIIFFIIC
jgi:hypothetical protein